MTTHTAAAGAQELFTTTDGVTRLLASRCDLCAAATFPAQATCPACHATLTTRFELPARGTLWTWTTQPYQPKSPPYRGPVGDAFEPFALGFVDLGGELLVEGVLTEADPARLHIGMPMEVTLSGVGRSGDGQVTGYAFAPVEGDR